MSPYIGATELTLVLPANVSIGTNTVPLTLNEVASVITEISAELDAAAAQAGYSVPVSSQATYAYALMQQKTKQGAAAHVLGILFPGLGGPGSRSSLASDYRRAYEEFVKALRKGELPLVDGGSSSGGGARELPRSGEISYPPESATPAISIHSVF